MSKHLEVTFTLRANIQCRLYLYQKRVHIETGVVGIYDNLTAVCSILININNLCLTIKNDYVRSKHFHKYLPENNPLKRKTVYFL